MGPAGMHLGVEDVEVRGVEVAAQPREQVDVVGRIDQNLQTFAERRRPCLDDRQRRVDSASEKARMPGDLVGVVASEVADVERLPQGVFQALGYRMQMQKAARRLFAAGDLGSLIRLGAAQCAQRQAIQILEQLALPCVPDLRAGASNVGDGEQVQGSQPALGANERRERFDHLRLRQVLFLGHPRQLQMRHDEELDQRRIVVLDRMASAESTHLDGAELGVVAAAAFGHVVEQCGDIEDPRLVPGGRQV